MSREPPRPVGTPRAKIGIAVAVTVLAALAIGLLVVIESPAPTPSLGQRVRVGEQASDRRSPRVNRPQPDRPRAEPAPDRKPPGKPGVASPPAPAPLPGAQPVPAPRSQSSSAAAAAPSSSQTKIPKTITEETGL